MSEDWNIAGKRCQELNRQVHNKAPPNTSKTFPPLFTSSVVRDERKRSGFNTYCLHPWIQRGRKRGLADVCPDRVTLHWLRVPRVMYQAAEAPAEVGSSDDDGPTTPPPCISAAHVNKTSSSTRALSVLDYPRYMARLLAAEEFTPISSPGAGSTETSPTIKGNCICDLAEHPGTSQTAWANALIGRIFWDFLREKYWADAVSHKIQKKLSKIRVRAVSLSQKRSVGGAAAGLHRCTADDPADQVQPVQAGCRPILSVLADSDEESSSAGSSDEEELLLSEPQGPVGEKGSTPATDGTGGGKTGRKILRFVDKIAKSKYFQKATENEFIKKKFEEMSNTPLLLTVEVQELSGTLVINIPPPPTDRIWYSFCVPPKLDLHVRPKLGEREKVFVLPNMDDICLPLMHTVLDGPQASQPLSSQSQQSQSSSTESIERIPPESD
ncbi:Testis-expressed protein 2 [Larimichthys crocea]|uniref:Uncharacterized protein n=1 Tax=Larimichthys crocea TaxID=215358 RepID=A0ACD3RSD3_LARCR|nr:Testis-expressed protein 2 [Larimichthys crocea]